MDDSPAWIDIDGRNYAVDDTGDGTPVILLHGLTATRRYVVHGSSLLARTGFRVVAFDARGHGDTPAPDDGDYSYPAMARDTLRVMDALDIESAVLVGSSMGSATAIATILQAPERVQAFVSVTPAHRGAPSLGLERWDSLSEGLRTGGVEGFMDAYGPLDVPERWRTPIETVMRQRLRKHAHPQAVAAALAATPRSVAFDGIEALAGVQVPTLVVASRDEIDSDHPKEIADTYVATIPNCQMVIENDGESPLAWRGGAVSKAIAEFLSQLGITP